MLECYHNTQIRKKEVDLPMKFNIDELTDYPPKFLITAHPEAAAKRSVTPQLTIQGLDRELTFPVIMGETMGEPVLSVLSE